MSVANATAQLGAMRQNLPQLKMGLSRTREVNANAHEVAQSLLVLTALAVAGLISTKASAKEVKGTPERRHGLCQAL